MDAVRRAIESSAIRVLPDRLEGVRESGDSVLLWLQVVDCEAVRSVLVSGNLRVPELEALTAGADARILDG